MSARTGKIGPRSITELRSGEIIWDNELRRFGARRRTTGITYFVKARIDKRQRWITLGRHGPLTPAQARGKAKQVLGEIDAGADPTRARTADRGKPLFADFTARWLKEHVALKRKPNTLREYRRIVRMYLDPALGKIRIDRVVSDDALRIHADLAHAKYQANRVIAILSAIMTFAEDTGHRDRFSNPCRSVERFKEYKRKRPLTLAELTLLWRHLISIEGSVNPFVIAAFRLLLLTGMRRDELLCLRWCHVDLAEGLLRLPDSKGGPRNVMLSRSALGILERLARIDGNPFVLPGAKEGQRLVNISRHWDAIRRELGFPHVRIHDIRHSVGSLLAARAPLVVVRDALGHREIHTTNGYSHTEEGAVRIAFDELADRVTGRS